LKPPFFAPGITGRRKHHWQNRINQRLTITDGASALMRHQSSAGFAASSLARVLRSQGQGRRYGDASSKVFRCERKNILLRICVYLFPGCPLMVMPERHLKHK
jgi:hypothetical protein